ncbi:hypothetical protein PMI07_002067 [Rhizobium sp. CF080]|uniref:hypothetical protein n=1 Tax=Rhizobium sp. (strain CF080) TaxID=1144310 RepID=UPI000271CE01|nr:hypothetical protein [Rhizobium sp. CF080]EUB95579.1 hypothetical protein PMI07_002067 [Rhizobium sp. CF080]
MSAVVSIETPTAVFIITDGAIYDADNILLDVRRKVTVSERVPAAVATRGNQGVGDYFAAKIIDAIERMGFDAAMIALADVLPQFADKDRMTKFEATIAGISEEYGPRRLVFRSDVDPLALEHDGVGSSCATSDAGLVEMGIRGRAPLEPWKGYIREIAIPIMQFYREAAVPGVKGETFAQPAHLVGGQVDFTIITRQGVTVETIHRWDDKLGERIAPFVKRQTVKAFPGLNRQQRRAAERALSKTA